MDDSVRDFLGSFSVLNNADIAMKNELADMFKDQQLLISIGRNLAVERDPEKLLRMILHIAKKITGSDAGSIFLVEGMHEDRMLRFKYSHTYSLNLDYEEFVMKCDLSSIAGYVAITGDVLNIPNVYEIPEKAPYHFNPAFDKRTGYISISMLVVPMKNHLDEIIGVIQLINSKEDSNVPDLQEAERIYLNNKEDFFKKVVPFKERYESLMVAVANQAAISLENSRMIKQIQTQFESFVTASVSAIESRDPATSGHSSRVATMAVALAKAVAKENEGPYAGIYFNSAEIKELEYSGLLHDFGKVYIDAQVFLKAKKLYPKDYECMVMRYNYLYQTIEASYDKAILEIGLNTQDPLLTRKRELEEEKSKDLSNLLSLRTLIDILNEPQVIHDDVEAALGKFTNASFSKNMIRGIHDEEIPVITDHEIKNLSIKKGSLNSEERTIIESHVEHTYTFVSKIPWPREYANIPEYTYKHHEMLDGSGYPQKLSAASIPLQARMLAICDIYDALQASDRPYKKALPFEKVKLILTEEAEKGKIDKELVRIFFKDECYKHI